MATELNEAAKLGNLIIRESSTGPLYTREVLTQALSQVLTMGEIVELDGSGNVISYNGGTNDAFGICLQDQTTDGVSTADVLLLVNGPAVVDLDNVTGSDDEAVTALAAKEIKMIAGPTVTYEMEG